MLGSLATYIFIQPYAHDSIHKSYFLLMLCFLTRHTIYLESMSFQKKIP